MAYPATLATLVDPDYTRRTRGLIDLCTYVNAINAQQSGGSTYAVGVPDQSSSEGFSPAFGLIYINLCVAALNAAITRTGVGLQPETATLTGTPTTGNAGVTFTSTAVAGSPLTVTGAIVGADTLTTAAAKIAAAINANAVLKALGVVASSAGAVVSINQPASVSPQITFTASNGGGLTVTLAATGGAIVASGSLYNDLDYSAFTPALNMAITLATTVKTAFGG